MTWTTFHHRGETLRSVIAAANARRDGRLPMDVDGVSETFGDELALLAALQLRWHTRLAGTIDRELMAEPLDLPRAVEVAWTRTYDELAGVRMVLDHYRAEPSDAAMATAMAKATGKEHAMLAAMAGRASVDDPAAIPVGARIEAAARASYAGPPPLVVDDPRPSFLERLRSVLAA